MTLGLRTRPERLVIALVVLAWAWMLGHAVTAGRFTCCAPDPTFGEDVGAWLAMLFAMMVPTTIDSMRDVAARSYRVRRFRAVLEYLAGYLAGWLALGLIVAAIRSVAGVHDPKLATVLCLVAAAWALVPARERWFRGCHRQIPLCPVGWRADLDAFRQGASNGAPCMAMCWPLMLACTFTGHDLVLMVGGTLLVVIEKRMFRLDRRPLFIGALLLAAWTLAS